MRILILLMLLFADLVGSEAVTTWGNHQGVYDFVDPITGRRFLVTYCSLGMAMIEATPVPVAAHPFVVVTAPPVEAGPVGMWDDTVTWKFTQAQSAVGYRVTSTETINGRELCHIRRKNPKYIEPVGPEK